MRGSIVRRAKDRYAIILELTVTDPATGKPKRKRKWHNFRGHRDEAEAERVRLLAKLNGGVYVEPNKTKLKDYLTEWLGHIKSSVEPRTHERYTEIVEQYLSPALGDVILTKLRHRTIAEAYDKIRTARTKGKGELSNRTILHCHRVLSSALRKAVEWELLINNPASAVKPPKVERKKMATHSLTQSADLLESLRGHWMHVPALLGVMCGMRRGEIAALRWGSVDLDNGQIAVEQSAEQTKAGVRYKQPKSGQARTLALSPAVVAELKAHRLRLAEAMLKLGRPLTGDDFVVMQADGQPYDPASITKEWRLRIIASNLPRIRFHDLRHTHATHMLAAKVHPKVASERLGHSRVGITLDTYSHVVEGMQSEAVSLVDAEMAKALQKRAAEK